MHILSYFDGEQKSYLDFSAKIANFEKADNKDPEIPIDTLHGMER